jgi:hypothetical protein
MTNLQGGMALSESLLVSSAMFFLFGSKVGPCLGVTASFVDVGTGGNGGGKGLLLVTRAHILISLGREKVIPPPLLPDPHHVRFQVLFSFPFLLSSMVWPC